MAAVGSKSEQKMYWSQSAAAMERWLPLSRQASRILVERMISLADIKPGGRVLDIATGIGDPAIDIARTNPQASVLGTDISPERLEVARRRSEQEGLSNIAFLEGDFEEIQLLERFDAVLCKWGLMFFADVPKALGKIYSVLRQGGTFTAAVWAEKNLVHSTKLTFDVLGLLGTPLPAQIIDPFRFSDQAKLVDMLTAAGFSEILVERICVEYRYDSIESLQKFMYDANYTFRESLRLAGDVLSPEKVKAAIREAARPYMDGQSIVLPNESILVRCLRR